MTARQAASWVQLAVLYEQRTISKADLRASTEEDEQFVDSILTSVTQEQSHFAHGAVCKVSRGLIEPEQSDWRLVRPYILSLIFDILGASEDEQGTRLFERVVARSLTAHLGCLTFDNGATSGVGLRERLVLLADAAHLSRLRDAESRYKDDRVDLVAHTTFHDGRSANVYLLMQCAAGRNWERKQQIPLDRWAQYLDWPRTNLVAGMATAQFIGTTRWRDLSTEFGVLMDRVRIQASYPTELSELDEELDAWVERRIGEALGSWEG